MWRCISPLAFAAGLLAILGCQKPDVEMVTVAQIAEKLLEQKEEPYEFAFHTHVTADYGGGGESDLFQAKGVMLHSSQWVASQLVAYSYGVYETGHIFEKRAKGLIHSLEEEGHGGSREWECNSHSNKVLTLDGMGIYPRGGWSLCSQAGSLIQDFPPTRNERKDSGPMLYWDSVPAELESELGRQFENSIFDDPFEVESLRLGVSQDLKFPASLEVILKSGMGITMAFSEYELMRGKYYSRMQDLRAELNIPTSSRCWCSGEIYDVQLELPGRPIR